MTRQVNDSSCELLSAFFEGSLNDSDATQFEAHLESCNACRAAVDQQQWIEELLRSVDAATMQRAPDAGRLILSQRLAAAQRRQQTRAALVGLTAAAAALLLSAFIWTPERDGGQVQPGQRAPIAQRPTTANEQPRPAAPLPGSLADATRMTAAADVAHPSNPPEGMPLDSAVADQVIASPAAEFHGNGDVIALELESPSPEVTVFQVYTTTDAQRRGRLAAMLSSTSSAISGDF